MGTGVDICGELASSHALANESHPALDNQLAVYDSVQKVLSAAITNMANPAPSSSPPTASDLVYGGDVGAWTALAHTLKARFYMHTAEVRPAAYAQALAEAQQGISSDAGTYFGALTTNTNETNSYYQ